MKNDNVENRSGTRFSDPRVLLVIIFAVTKRPSVSRQHTFSISKNRISQNGGTIQILNFDNGKASVVETDERRLVEPIISWDQNR